MHSGNWSSRRRPGCAGGTRVSHLSGASQPTPLTPDRPDVPPTPFSHLPPPPPKASPRSRALSRMSYFPSGKGLERVRPGVGKAGVRGGIPSPPPPESRAGGRLPSAGQGRPPWRQAVDRAPAGHFPRSGPLLPPSVSRARPLPAPRPRRRPSRPAPPRPAPPPLTARGAAAPGTVGAPASSVRETGAVRGRDAGSRHSRGRRLRKSFWLVREREGEGEGRGGRGRGPRVARAGGGLGTGGARSRGRNRGCGRGRGGREIGAWLGLGSQRAEV